MGRQAGVARARRAGMFAKLFAAALTLPLSRTVRSKPELYQPGEVRLFIKPYCGWCRQAMDWLDDRGIRYSVLDVIRDSAAYDEMLRLSGQTFAPVIEVDGQVLADFGARELAEFWQKLSAS